MVRLSWLFKVLGVVALVAMAVLPSRDASARATASGLRLGMHPDDITRVVLDLTESVTFSTVVQADPDRIVVNLSPVTWSPGAERPVRGVIKGMRYDEDGQGGHLSIELGAPALVKSAFVIPPRDGLGWRFVLDLRSVPKATFRQAAQLGAPAPSHGKKAQAVASKPQQQLVAPVPAEASRNIVVISPQARPAADPVPSSPIAVTAPLPEARPTEPETRNPVATERTGSPVMSMPVPPPLERPAVTQAMATAPVEAAPPVVTKAAMTVPMPDPVEPKALPADGKPVVVIDAGHGGVDPGAIGVSGVYEKFITLAMAKELKAQLEKGGRYKVYLTRDRDVFIRLRDRIAIARQYDADLFISLHADTVANSQMKGLSVYTLSQNASDSEAQALADKENKADLIAGVDLSHESADVANILIDLAQRETMNRSAVFATSVVDSLGRQVDLLGNTHRFAGFAVLKAPDVPAVLVEMGYLSNVEEERQLRQPDYRGKLAKALSLAVDHFFVQGQKARRP